MVEEGLMNMSIYTLYQCNDKLRAMKVYPASNNDFLLIILTNSKLVILKLEYLTVSELFGLEEFVKDEEMYKEEGTF